MQFKIARFMENTNNKICNLVNIETETAIYRIRIHRTLPLVATEQTQTRFVTIWTTTH